MCCGVWMRVLRASRDDINRLESLIVFLDRKHALYFFPRLMTLRHPDALPLRMCFRWSLYACAYDDEIDIKAQFELTWLIDSVYEQSD